MKKLRLTLPRCDVSLRFYHRVSSRSIASGLRKSLERYGDGRYNDDDDDDDDPEL